MPSPPDDSERIPGMLRKISAVVLGVACSMLLGFKVVMLTLDLSLLDSLVTPVMTTSFRPALRVVSDCIAAEFAANALKAGTPRAHNVPINLVVVLFMPSRVR